MSHSLTKKATLRKLWPHSLKNAPYTIKTNFSSKENNYPSPRATELVKKNSRPRSTEQTDKRGVVVAVKARHTVHLQARFVFPRAQISRVAHSFPSFPHNKPPPAHRRHSIHTRSAARIKIRLAELDPPPIITCTLRFCMEGVGGGGTHAAGKDRRADTEPQRDTAYEVRDA